MKTHEKFSRQVLNQKDGVRNYTRQVFGLEPNALERHLQILNRLQTNAGGMDSRDRKWLLDQAKAAGRDVQRANRDIQRVIDLPNPKDRAAAYVRGSYGQNIAQGQVDFATNVATRYGIEHGATMAGERMAAHDRHRAKSHFGELPDSERFEADRKEANAVRYQILTAMADRGLIETSPHSLEEAQASARQQANRAADALERTSLDSKASRRDHVEAVVNADQAFQRLNDAGVADTSMGDVYDETSTRLFAERD